MFTIQPLDVADKAAFYDALTDQVKHLIADERNDIANMSNVSALLNLTLPDINWVGFYLWYETEQTLILGPFQGKPACIRIASGRGVCGTAVATREVQVVPDVHAFPGHIACDADSRSEVVIPMLKGDGVVGVLDIDSPQPGRFTAEDAAGLSRIVDILLAGTDFAHR